jgi:hypothetical protein
MNRDYIWECDIGGIAALKVCLEEISYENENLK